MKYLLSILNFVITVIALFGFKFSGIDFILFNCCIIVLAIIILIFNIIINKKEQELRKITPIIEYIDED